MVQIYSSAKVIEVSTRTTRIGLIILVETKSHKYNQDLHRGREFLITEVHSNLKNIS